MPGGFGVGGFGIKSPPRLAACFCRSGSRGNLSENPQFSTLHPRPHVFLVIVLLSVLAFTVPSTPIPPTPRHSSHNVNSLKGVISGNVIGE